MKDLSIVILTGAGISKESGLDTFRDADGIWARVRIEDVASRKVSRPDSFEIPAPVRMTIRRSSIFD